MSLQRTLLVFTAVALLAGILPAGVALDRRLASELEDRARRELALAPRFLADRNEAIAEGLRMHARDVARAPGVVEAVAIGDRARALLELEAARGSYGDRSILVAADGRVWTGPTPPRELVDRTRHGETPVTVISDGDSLHSVALAPVRLDGLWIGAAGVGLTVGKGLAGTLAGITRAEVVILDARKRIAATTDTTAAATIASSLAGWPMANGVHEARTKGRRYLVARVPLGDVATVVFVRDLQRELAVLPTLRGVLGLSGLGALVLGLLLGGFLARRVVGPVRSLATAADRLTEGDFEAPLPRSSIRELNSLAGAFDRMRSGLAGRLRELEEANRELADRQERLGALKAEVLQRERLAASGRLVTELAHEIRNPVASLRNSLELIRRRMSHDPEGRDFANLAIDELRRLHDLAEQMLDLNRPRDPSISVCSVRGVALEVARLAMVGVSAGELAIRVTGEAEAAIAPDALKQVLLNLVENARESRPQALEIDVVIRWDGPRVVVDVLDNGPGIPAEILPRIFDPFFTTKGSVYGVGLGLFIAEGLVRRHGGMI
ncbi:MAG: ATP-binding protein, partial [Gemmatimonadota bacterium]